MTKVRLGDVAPIIQSSKKKDSKPVWLLTLDMVESETGNILEYKYASSNKIGTSTCKFDTENVLYSKLRPYLNKVVLPDRDGFATSEMLALKPDKTKLSREYLMYYLRSPSFVAYISEKVSGAKMPRARTEDLYNAQLSLPSLKKQDEVVKTLSQVIKLIILRKKQLENLDRIVMAKFIEMFGDPTTNPFGWDKATLNEISVGKLSYGSGASANPYDGKIRYVRITDINDIGVLRDDLKSPNTYDPIYDLNDGDILFARSGATVGKTYCHSDKYGKCIYAGYLIRLIPNRNKALPLYVFHFTKSRFYNEFVTLNQRTVAQPNINAQQYGNLTICLPPLELQKQFSEFVEQVDKSKLDIQESLDKLETLKKSLMQEYFD